MKQDLFAEGRKGWKERAENPFFAVQMSEAREAAERYRSEVLPACSYSLWKLFHETGSRTEYEAEYFAKRGRLNAFALLVLSGGAQEDLDALENTIWAICDECTWALPAHVPAEMEVEKWFAFIDLFAAETGFALCEMESLLGDKLSEPVQSRIRCEVRRRILEPYMQSKENPFWWESVESNWAAVCAGSVGAAFLYQAEEDEIAKVLPRIEQTMQCFIKSFSDDGVCLEGYGYWQYGFGFFVYFAELLRQYTSGKQDWFTWPKVEKIAEFQQNAILNDGFAISFSDGQVTYTHNIGLSQFLHRRFPKVTVPEAKYNAHFDSDHCHRWSHFIRNFAWAQEECGLTDEKKERTTYLPGAGWYIRETGKYSLAAKAGHNAEQHNHNDVGSFLLCAAGQPILCDLGCGEYTKDYFGEKRYTFLVNGSRGHSVPVVAGEYQKLGREYCGTVTEAGENVFELEFSKAYGLDALQSLVRRFSFGLSCVEISDRFVLDGMKTEIVERFIATWRPEQADGMVTIGNAKLVYDASVWSCEIEQEEYNLHDGVKATAYLIDFHLKQTAETVDAVFSITVE